MSYTSWIYTYIYIHHPFNFLIDRSNSCCLRLHALTECSVVKIKLPNKGIITVATLPLTPTFVLNPLWKWCANNTTDEAIAPAFMAVITPSINDSLTHSFIIDGLSWRLPDAILLILKPSLYWLRANMYTSFSIANNCFYFCTNKWICSIPFSLWCIGRG